MDNIEHQELLAEVASLYYEKGLSQAQIGEQLDLSRVKVYRILKEANEEGIVQISITWPIERDSALEAELVKIFHIEKALVIKTGILDYDTALRRLGQTAARYLESTLKDGMTLAINLGQSTYEVINAIRPGFQVNVNVAQAMGSLISANKDLDSSTLARQLAQKLSGKFYNLPSPIMANSSQAAQIFREQPSIERTLSLARHADISLVGIGGIDPERSHYVAEALIPAENLVRMGQNGAVGDLSGNFITISGALFDCVYNETMIGITLEDLRRIPNTVAVAMGSEKKYAILGALRTGVINTFCTDNRTANEIISLNASK
jgi:DNA-binding transcriptional regulator LsrR (DeoR family)